MAQTETSTRSDTLTDSPLMKHLIEALEQGTDIGHYGRLTFVMVAQYFMSADEMLALLTKEPDVSETDARALVMEVKAHGYNPPKRNTILHWQQEQDFPICPSGDDPNSCNVYDELQFPQQVYDQIGRFWEDRAEAKESQ
ncbi:MAG: hypothetical protein M3Z66_01280 [Chloroflexota bacterium]|nr:hypothetical protein [Chloroflexota bacterium]